MDGDDTWFGRFCQRRGCLAVAVIQLASIAGLLAAIIIPLRLTFRFIEHDVVYSTAGPGAYARGERVNKQGRLSNGMPISTFDEIRLFGGSFLAGATGGVTYSLYAGRLGLIGTGTRRDGPVS